MTRRQTTGTLHLLTVRQVQAASEGDLADGGGLVLRVRGESVSWVLRYTGPSSRRREMGLGVVVRGSPRQAGDSLTGARDDAHKARELLRQGLDPIDQRDAGKVKLRQAEAAQKAEKAREHWTLARAAREYHARAIETTKTTKHAADWINSLENHLPASIWHKPITEIDPPELLRALAGVTAHARARRVGQGARVMETLQRIRQRLDAVFEDAIFHKRCSSNPAAAVRRKMAETLPKKNAGKLAALPYKQAPALLQRVQQATGTAARCLEFAVLTAARTGEVLGATWGEIDLEAATWLVPSSRMKSSGKEHAEEHLVHLSTRAVAILKGQLGQHATIVFPSTMLADRPLSNMAMLAMLDRLGVRDQTTVHGLCRATFSTWAYDTAAARPDVIEACLAHREADKVKAAYNRAQFTQERKELLQAWAHFLAQPSAMVLPFARVA
jgi:integrase